MATRKRRPTNMARIERIVADLPEAERVDIAAWDDHPTFRVRGKNFVFSDHEATSLSVKLSKEEAAAVVATEVWAAPASYGLGRHGWVSISVPPDADEDWWQQLTEWVVTSYTMLAPKKLAQAVLDREG